MAYAREVLGLDGMDVQTALNVRDKSRMKTVLREAGVPCARHQLVTNAAEALAFAEAVGFRWWQNLRPVLERRPRTGWMILVRYTVGWSRFLPMRMRRDCSRSSWSERNTPFDSVTVGGQTVFSSIADYWPTPLEVLRQPWIQWTVLLPRELDDPRYDGIWEIGPAALRALAYGMR